MKFSYYPGCTLKTKAQKLEKYGLDSAKVLGIDLIEQKEWQCCGAVYPLASNEIATRLSAVRSLVDAHTEKRKLVTICTACHHVLKRTNEDLKIDENFRKKANNYLELENIYSGEGEVIHYLEMLKNEFGFDKLKEKVVNPLNRKIGAYYGCMLLKPHKQMQVDDPENPTIIEEFIEALGGIPVVYPYRNECCGAYLAVNNKELTEKMSNNIIASAVENNAMELVTACPLCKYNLELKNELPIKYFTEILAEALGIEEIIG
ncbi:CoB--CoM heterodisulfide reductase iron-sulfur subunit B family protein [Fusobacterium sp. SYSU M8D902]|uniref:CoB--CoM heterodisulfide reductase iron-sulfur subunit B family protein n=1 Tax=Fusobacterium sp. SYSU M8D902 TaxID=3159562 RepID=UPI0032E3888D